MKSIQNTTQQSKSICNKIYAKCSCSWILKQDEMANSICNHVLTLETNSWNSIKWFNSDLTCSECDVCSSTSVAEVALSKIGTEDQKTEDAVRFDQQRHRSRLWLGVR